MNENKPRSQANPQPSTLEVHTDGAGQIRATGQSLPWLPPYGLVETTEDGRRRVIRHDGSPGRYLD
jgi:hypothetical protein